MWKISYEKVMSETPVGLVENCVMCIEFDGRKFHQVEVAGTDFIDVDTGEIVKIQILEQGPRIVDK